MPLDVDTISTFETLPESIAEFEAMPMTVAEFEAGFEYAGNVVPDGVHINDLRFKALGEQGFTGALDDRIAQWLRSNGAVSPNVSDAWHEMIQAQGFPWTFHRDDGWFGLLGVLGYTGSIQDREKQFWEDGGTFGMPLVPSSAVGYASFDGGQSFFRLDVSPWVEIFPVTDSTIASGLDNDFSVSAQLYALSGASPNVEVWSVDTYPFTKVFTYDNPSLQSNVVRFSRDGALLFIGLSTSGGFRIYLSDFETFEEVTGFQSMGADFSNNRNYLVVGTTQAPYLRFYDSSAFPPEELSAVSNMPSTERRAISFHPTRNIFVAGGAGQTIIVYDMDLRDRIGTFTLSATCYALEFDHSGNRLLCSLTGTTSANTIVYDCTDIDTPSAWAQLPVDNSPTSGGGYTAAWATDDMYFTTGIESALAGAWDTSTQPYMRVPDYYDSAVLGLNGATFFSQIPLTEEVPRVVTGLSLDPTLNKYEILATWDSRAAFPPVTSYTLQWRYVGDQSWTDVSGGLSLSYNITGLESGELIEAQVFATNSVGDGPASGIMSATVEGNPPTQIQNLVLSLNAPEQITATWDALLIDPPVLFYVVEYKEAQQGSWSVINVGLSTTTDITGLTAGVLYDVRVFALNNDGTGPKSDIEQATPLATVPSKVLNLITSIPNDNAIFATWDATLGEASNGYIVYYKVASGNSWQAFDAGNVLQYEFTGLTAGETYDVRVNGYNNSGAGPSSDWSQETVEAAPLQPATITPTSLPEAMQLNWALPVAYPALTGLELWVKKSSESVWLNWAVTSTQTSTTIYNLEGSTQYDFQLRGINSRGAGQWQSIAATPSSISGENWVRWNDEGLSTTSQVTFLNNTGTRGSDFDLTGIVNGNNLDLTSKKGLPCFINQGDARLDTEGAGPELATSGYFVWAGIPQQVDNFRWIWVSFGTRLAMRIQADSPEVSASTGSLMRSNEAFDVGVETIVFCVMNGGNSKIRIIKNNGADVTTNGQVNTGRLSPEFVHWDYGMGSNQDFPCTQYEMNFWSGAPSAAEEDTIINAMKQKWFTGVQTFEPIP